LEGIKTVKLSSIATEITDGTRVKRNYIDEGIRLINVGDFKDGTIYQPSIKSISAEGLREKDYIKENDVLVTAVGRSGQVVRVTSNLEDCVISSDIIRIRLKQPFTARRLVAYLNSEAGQYALESIKSGLINRISISDIKELKIPADYESISFNEPIQTQ
jgi:restriction endonuclease S subunit